LQKSAVGEYLSKKGEIPTFYVRKQNGMGKPYFRANFRGK